MIEDGFSQRRVTHTRGVFPSVVSLQTLGSLSGDWKLQQKARAGYAKGIN